MALVSTGGHQTMLSSHGTRQKHGVHQLCADGVVLDNRYLFIDPATTAPGTLIAPIIYVPPTSEGIFPTDPPTMTVNGQSVTCPATDIGVRSWAPFILTVGPGGVSCENVALTSQPGSQRRPVFVDEHLVMDQGHLNAYH